MMDMMKMLGKMKEIQAKLKDAQDQLGNIIAEGESGGGMVKAVANGKKQLLKIQIDKDIAKPEDVEMLEDLIVAAVNRALEAVEEKSKDYIQQETEGLLNIPGMDLNSLMKG
jgi:DNA-binding YbaB/EbfC family protein